MSDDVNLEELLIIHYYCNITLWIHNYYGKSKVFKEVVIIINIHILTANVSFF